jgi:hypothetical protein
MLPENALNGGLPEPPASEAVRVIDAHHDACGASTRVRLPGTLSPRAVRRFHCAGCASAFETAQIEEVELRMDGVAAPPGDPAVAVQPQAMEERAVEALTRTPRKLRFSLPSLPSLPTLSLPSFSLPSIEPDSSTWRLLSIPIAAVLVIVGLVLFTGGDDQKLPPAPAPTADQSAGTVTPLPPSGDRKGKSGAAGKPSKNTKFVHESSFSLALPEGWERIDPPAGATFAAVAADGGADATLWITQDPKLDFPTFINQSLAQLKTLAGSARVCERTPAPTPEATVVTLCADAPAGQPAYAVTLRVAGSYRYYLGTTVQPDTSPETSDAVDLITGSLTPELQG